MQQGNRWSITFYDDASPSHTQWATQTICFYYVGNIGTHQRYVWVSDSYPDWNGIASQEGDQVFMFGDFQYPQGQARDRGHDAMQWEIVTEDSKNMGAGHWQEWLENTQFGVTVGFGNTRLQRVGKCLYDNPNQALPAYMNINLPLDANGNPLVNPAGIPETLLD